MRYAMWTKLICEVEQFFHLQIFSDLKKELNNRYLKQHPSIVIPFCESNAKQCEKTPLQSQVRTSGKLTLAIS
ncbi:hypothetical protein T01_15814 [Trichinella spiralis]|uniref:Uncharacterized protein n=1 Tax=Trichinella spiralis TaxID=6334 RepID=A0A0V1BUM4_TRISP|nr:hypothetical protein T01_15814 [Trichinella spiralis]